MIQHIVFTKFADPATCVPKARELLMALPEKIPEIVTLVTGADVLHSDRSYDMALLVTFRSLEDLHAYDTHPAHAEVRKYIRANRTASATVDYEF